MRPALYGAVHPITRVTQRTDLGGRRRVDIVGPVCETGDSFLRDWPLGPVTPGDVLAIWVAGAYGMSQSSNYNGRNRAAEVLVNGGRYRVIRKRETFDELVRGQTF
jgi:diaminopimelate decarboxylase